MQTKESLRLVTLDLFDQLKNDNVVYAELRYAPLEHTKGGLTVEEVVRCVSDATAEGKLNTGIEGGIILCTLRHYTEAQSMMTVGLVESFSDHEVVGFDIAADEAGFPIDNHIKAFNFANENGISCTAHAGESRGPDSIWETLANFRPSRIGHGVRSVEDEKLMEYLKTNGFHLEVCPSSNVQTNVYKNISDHPIDKIYNSGVSMSINTDARSISGTTLTSEYEMLEQQFNWRLSQIRHCNLEAIQHAFTTNMIKERITNIIKNTYDPLQ
jgi:adenosine deaminase